MYSSARWCICISVSRSISYPQHLETTVSKVNVTVDDINYKMDKLNEPINVVSGIFNRKRSSAGFLGTVLGLKNILKKK